MSREMEFAAARAEEAARIIRSSAHSVDEAARRIPAEWLVENLGRLVDRAEAVVRDLDAAVERAERAAARISGAP